MRQENPRRFGRQNFRRYKSPRRAPEADRRLKFYRSQSRRHGGLGGVKSPRPLEFRRLKFHSPRRALFCRQEFYRFADILKFCP